MTRLRYNGVATAASPLSLGAALTSGGTTITFNAALKYGGGTAVPTIAGSDYIPLTIIDPLTLAASEVVYLTAYTAGATTGTITRGQEGTSGVAHASGDRVVMGAVVEDVEGIQSNPISGHSGIPNVFYATISSATLTGAITRYFPFTVVRSATLVSVKINVQSAGTAGHVTRAGIYAASSVWQPGTLIRDYGEVASDSGGIKSFTMPGTPDVLGRGRYLIGWRMPTAATHPTLRTLPYQCLQFPSYEITGNVHTIGLAKTEAYAAFPNPGNAWDTRSTSNAPNFVCPITLEWTD